MNSPAELGALAWVLTPTGAIHWAQYSQLATGPLVWVPVCSARVYRLGWSYEGKRCRVLEHRPREGNVCALCRRTLRMTARNPRQGRLFE